MPAKAVTLLACRAALVLVAAVGTAHAQPGPAPGGDDPKTVEARSHFQNGVKLYSAKNWQGALAWFNAPIPQPDHTLRAVKTALIIRESVENLYKELPPEFHLGFGAGIHCGDAVLGLIGTEKRLEYTAISDAVNTAKRIQENSARNQILISASAYERVSKEINARPHADMSVKGKTQPLGVFEVLGLK